MTRYESFFILNSTYLSFCDLKMGTETKKNGRHVEVFFSMDDDGIKVHEVFKFKVTMYKFIRQRRSPLYGKFNHP